MGLRGKFGKWNLMGVRGGRVWKAGRERHCGPHGQRHRFPFSAEIQFIKSLLVFKFGGLNNKYVLFFMSLWISLGSGTIGWAQLGGSDVFCLAHLCTASWEEADLGYNCWKSPSSMYLIPLD